MGKHLIVAGHGGSDGGAHGNGTNERDFTRTYFVDQIASEINKIKGHTATVYDKRQNMYLDTYYGGGMYWAKKQGYDTVTEVHEDGSTSTTATGGHVIVYYGYEPDAIDLAMRDTIHKFVGTRYTHKGHYGISGRSDLLQVNVGAEIGLNYRLLELGFITNAKDFNNMKNNHKAMSKEFAQAITGNVKATNTPVKKAVNKKTDTSPHGKTIEQLANEVIKGKHGTGDARKKSLGIQYNAVQRRVNEILLGKKSTPVKKKTTPKKKTVDQVARDIINGKGNWGTGTTRWNKLNKAGYNADAVQRRINQLM